MYVYTYTVCINIYICLYIVYISCVNRCVHLQIYELRHMVTSADSNSQFVCFHLKVKGRHVERDTNQSRSHGRKLQC